MAIIYSKCHNGVIIVPRFADGSAHWQASCSGMLVYTWHSGPGRAQQRDPEAKLEKMINSHYPALSQAAAAAAAAASLRQRHPTVTIAGGPGEAMATLEVKA